MYVALGCNQFFDDAGVPLSAGRVTVYAKGSDTPVPLYTDENGTFTPATNPYITANDGRVPTLFFAAALVDVKVEKSNGDGTYTELDTFVAGMDVSGITANNGVGTIAELRSLRPSAGMCVNVDGYYKAGDSPSRRYLWVESAATADDGGYIIGSNVDNSGRWMMLWEGERLPASLYGIMCGRGSSKARTDNLTNYVQLGREIWVANQYIIHVPAILDFDGAVYGTLDGVQNISYYLDGGFTTIHYIETSFKKSYNDITLSEVPRTIHCAGLRGEVFDVQYWLFDQDYTSEDRVAYNSDIDVGETVSDLMFDYASNYMRDAFLSCVACAKVKRVELYGSQVYGYLDSSSDLSGKLVLDYYQTSNPVYIYTTAVMVKTGRVFMSHLDAGSIGADGLIYTSGNIQAGGNLAVSGNASVTGDVEASGLVGSLVGYKDGSLTKTSMTLGALPSFPGGLSVGTYATMRVNRSLDTSKPSMFRVYSPTNAVMTLDIQSTSASFDPSVYGEGDIVVIANQGNALLEVQYASTRHADISPWQACAFIKPGAGFAYWFCLTPDSVS